MAEGGLGSKDGGGEADGGGDKARMGMEGSSTCGKCGKDAEGGAKCNMCKASFHGKCQGITAELFKAIVKFAGKGMHWYCNKCSSEVDRYMGAMQGMKERQDRLEAQLEALRQEVGGIKTEMTNKVESYADMVRDKGKLAGAETAGGTKVANVASGGKVLQMQVAEALDQENRKCNVMLMGVVEGNGEDSAKEVVDTVLKVLGVAKEEVEYIGRVGKKGSSQFHRRPIRVKVASSETRRLMFLRAAKLRDETAVREVFVTPDYTPKQQEGRRILRDKLRLYREEKKWGVRIQDSRIVQVHQGQVNVLFELEGF